MTKKELYDLAFREADCPKGCKGCSVEKPRKTCEFCGKECNGCVGLDEGCKSPKTNKDKKKTLININVSKDEHEYTTDIEIDDDISKKELIHVLRDILGIRI